MQIEDFEVIALIGSFEINLVDRSWSASKNFCKMFGLAFSNKFPFQALKNIIHADFYELAVQKFDDCIKKDSTEIFECICIGADNKPLFMECRVRLIRDDHGFSAKL